MKISIIYHVYNDYYNLTESIESILKQENKNFELILVLDAPFDNVLEIIDNFNLVKDKRVKIIKFMENFGRSFTYNFALDRASGDYIYFTESKVLLNPDFIDTLTTIIKNSNKKYDYINFLVTTNDVLSNLPYEVTKGGVNEIDNIINVKLTLKDKIFKKNFLINNKIEFAPYKNFHSLYIYNVLENYKHALYLDKQLATWKRELKKGYEYNLYNILESAEILCEKLMKKNDDEDKINAYLTWIPICILHEFIKKMYSSYYNNEKIVTKAIENAADLIDRIYPYYKKNPKLPNLNRQWISKYILEFKRNFAFVRKNIK